MVELLVFRNKIHFLMATKANLELLKLWHLDCNLSFFGCPFFVLEKVVHQKGPVNFPAKDVDLMARGDHCMVCLRNLHGTLS